VHVTAIIAAGGAGRRLGGGVPKQMLEIGGRTLLQRSVDVFRNHPDIAEVIVALPSSMVGTPPDWLGSVRLVVGGTRRQDSVANAFDVVPERTDIILVHDAARPFVTPSMISAVIHSAREHGAAIAAVPVSDTVKRIARGQGQAAGGQGPGVRGQGSEAVGAIVETLPRDEIYLAQTPQGFRRDVLRDAIALGRSGVNATDEAGLAERAGHRVYVVPGDRSNVKITTAADLEIAREREPRIGSASGRIGVGYDLHRLVDGRPLVLGGVVVPSDRGAQGHSDADVICHAVTDAILGAARAGDIGQHYPDTDAQWKDASSLALLRDVVALVRSRGLTVENVDVVVLLERPKLSSHRGAIEARLAEALDIDVSRVSVKAKTNEGMDAVGRGEAVAAHAVALLSVLPASDLQPPTS
jgi:2-C-methyl-D-erythritol 4-phosphate cytidylyltransferase / 2-C-methyl-D-erythritol 2,4-cyclodiphosphate synthase